LHQSGLTFNGREGHFQDLERRGWLRPDAVLVVDLGRARDRFAALHRGYGFLTVIDPKDTAETSPDCDSSVAGSNSSTPRPGRRLPIVVAPTPIGPRHELTYKRRVASAGCVLSHAA
jgi:hypothetical protein